ncbi:hypothetical protein PYW08_015244 [Mythimna loreyi]|uniref:Uncharacterized protein n=1 Tax=Mythimna loreyi TaxID=667449 RepID=A0ACC2QVE4_9NEOP|nr:hypothetical protein PYW08_015244 [Mythimna loreyi]
MDGKKRIRLSGAEHRKRAKEKNLPGTVMIMDNFRVLHGRTGFSGSRVLGGSYVARSDWLDKARALGLIH